MERVQVQDSLAAVVQLQYGKYRYEFPRSLCFGLVISGGLLISAGHKVARRYIADNPKLALHPHLLQSAVYFFRPLFASPKQAEVYIRLANASKIWTTLHVDILQSDKVCMSGYFIFTDLNLPGQISVSTGWTLLPAAPAPPAAIATPQAEDDDPDWVSYLTPIAPDSIRNASAYFKFQLPIRQTNPSFLDQWVTPGWNDNSRSNGAVWTNELVHFVIDNHLSYWSNYIDSSVMSYCRYEDIIAAGLEQRQARKDGRDDRIFGENCGPTGPLNWISSSVSISTEIKRLLPGKGTKWLFMRCVSSKLKHNRLDEQVMLLDAKGDLIAISHQLVHIVPHTAKTVDKKAKI